MVNECRAGSSGWIELSNRGTRALELARDPDHCWLVDDSEGGGHPKVLSDLNVTHDAGSRTCAMFGRPPTCAVIAPGERVVVRYAYINGTTPDECRFASAPRLGETCGAAISAAAVGGATRASSSGDCFGRQPDGMAWGLDALACTRGEANGACRPGRPCDDDNACTTGETFSATCACAGGTPSTGNACASGRSCQAGRCADAGTTMPAEVVKRGTRGLLLSGTLVTGAGASERGSIDSDVLEGDVLIVDDEIRCVAASCRSDPAALEATWVETQAVIYPGLIDTHNHIQFDIFDEHDWAPEPTDNFTNHNQWPNRKRYKALVDAKQYLNGEAGSPVSIGCELVKYGELKGLIAGTTSIVGGAIPTNKACYGSVARTIDQGPNGLAADKIQTATLFPAKTADADKICKNLADGTTAAYLPHIAEGVDATARREFRKLFDISSERGCLFSSKTAIVHGAALEEADFGEMAARGMSLVWSPRSNVFLYGHGSDWGKTADIPALLERGVAVALAPDWSIGGSQNILDELRFADQLDNARWGDAITPKQLVAMVTKNAARVLGLQETLGRIAPRLKADLVAIAGDRTTPYDTLLRATPRDVRLVLVGGNVLYGDASLASLGQTEPPCEALDICGAAKFACVAAPGSSAANKFDQTYSTIQQTIVTELQRYDEKNLSDWDFSPIAPLYACP